MGEECFGSSSYCIEPLSFFIIKNVPYGPLDDNLRWATGGREIHNQQQQHHLDPVLTIRFYLSNFQDGVPLFLSLFALFERTFFETTYLHLWIEDDDADDAEVFLPLLDSFRGFLILEKLVMTREFLVKLLFPLLQGANSVLFPALKSLYFREKIFHQSSNTILRMADFLQ